MSLQELIELDMSLYALALSMELLALLRLRWTEPELRRPFRVPLGRWCLAVTYVVPLGLCVFEVLFSLHKPSMRAAWLWAVGSGLAMNMLGPKILQWQGRAEYT